MNAIDGMVVLVCPRCQSRNSWHAAEFEVGERTAEDLVYCSNCSRPSLLGAWRRVDGRPAVGAPMGKRHRGRRQGKRGRTEQAGLRGVVR